MAIKSHQVWVLSCEGDQIIRHSAIEMEHPGPAGCIVNHLRPAPVRVIIAAGATTGDLIRAMRASTTSKPSLGQRTDQAPLATCPDLGQLWQPAGQAELKDRSKMTVTQRPKQRGENGQAAAAGRTPVQAWQPRSTKGVTQQARRGIHRGSAHRMGKARNGGDSKQPRTSRRNSSR